MYFAGIAVSVDRPKLAISSPDVERRAHHVPLRFLQRVYFSLLLVDSAF